MSVHPRTIGKGLISTKGSVDSWTWFARFFFMLKFKNFRVASKIVSTVLWSEVEFFFWDVFNFCSHWGHWTLRKLFAWNCGGVWSSGASLLCRRWRRWICWSSSTRLWSELACDESLEVPPSILDIGMASILSFDLKNFHSNSMSNIYSSV